MSYSLPSVICHWLYLAMFRPQIAFVSQIRSERWSVRTAICKWARRIFGPRQHQPNHLGCCGNDVGRSRYVLALSARFPHAVKLWTGQFVSARVHRLFCYLQHEFRPAARSDALLWLRTWHLHLVSSCEWLEKHFEMRHEQPQHLDWDASVLNGFQSHSKPWPNVQQSHFKHTI